MNIPSTVCQIFTIAAVEKDDAKSPEPDEIAYAPNSRANVTGLWKFTMQVHASAGMVLQRSSLKDSQLASDGLIGFEERS